MAALHRSGQVRIELLGGFRVVVGGVEFDDTAWPSRRSAELVQLLALSRRRSLPREQVIEALWAHLGPEAGAANLRKAAHYARQALGREDAVVLSGGRATLFPADDVVTDVECFERMAEAALHSRDGVVSAEAASAYGGDLLPAALYEEWTHARRNRLRSLQVELLRLSAQWDRLVELEPSDEQAYQELMRAALRGGNRPSAIRWYGRLRASLEGELGLPPSRESQDLYEECVAGLGAVLPALVGREMELATAASALAAAGRGEVGALVVSGSAGIGKSALCRRFAAEASERGWRTVAVTATAGGRPYAPLAEAVRQLLSTDRGLLDAVGDRTRSILTALTVPARHPEGGLTRHMVIGAVRRLMRACRAARGVLLVLDDAQLADEATIEAFVFLARPGSRLPLVTVFAHRPEARPKLTCGVDALDRAGRLLRIDLGPLEPDEVAVLVHTAAPRPQAEAVARIVELAQGNPFFALESARVLVDSSGSAVPTSVWAAVTTRFLDLDPATAGLLRRLAVAGDDLDPAHIPAVTGLTEDEGFGLLDAALGAGALVVQGVRYRFRHELVRRALVEQVPPHQRIGIHRDTARRLAAVGGPPVLIAGHWLDGGRPDEAVPWLMAAAREAVGLGAYPAALQHLETLLDHAAEHAEALRLRAEVLDALGDGRAPAAYAAAVRAVGEPQAQDLRAMQALAQIKQGDPAGALRSADGLRPATVQGRLAHALTLCGAAVMGFVDPELGTAKAAECRRLALESGDRSALVVASWAQAAAAHARGDLRRSVWADLHDTATLRELAISVFDGHLCITQRLLYGARPYPDVVAFADAFAAEALRLGAVRGRAFALTLRGQAQLLAGSLDEADEDLQDAVRLSRTVAAPVGEALALQRRAEVALHRGHHREADMLLDDALALARESDIGFHLLDRIYGTMIEAARDPDGALATLDEAEAAVRGPLETCPGCRITLTVPAAIAAARAGDLDRARRHAEHGQSLAEVVMRLPAWDAAMDEVRGHLALAIGDVAGAATHFAAAAHGFRRVGQPLDEARCTALAGTPA